MKAYAIRRLAPATFVFLAAALALVSLMAFCNTQRAAAADQPTVSLTLVAGNGWDSPWFSAGSPVKGAFASNSDGVYITGVGTAVRSSDGYSWTLSLTDGQFLNPLTDSFLFQNGTISETWQINVGEVLTETRNDAWFDTMTAIAPADPVVGEPISFTLMIQNTGLMTGSVELTGAYTESLEIGAGQTESVDFIRTYEVPGTYTETVTINWAAGYSKTADMVVNVVEIPSEPTVELTLITEQGWDSPWFSAGSPVKNAFASNSDGVYITGVGTAVRSSDGYSWTLSVTDAQFLNPLTDIFTFESGVISETWQIAVSDQITEPLALRSDAWFSAEISGPYPIREVGDENYYSAYIYNIGVITDNVSYCLSWNGNCETVEVESGSYVFIDHDIEPIIYTEPGFYTQTITITWGGGYTSNDVHTVEVVNDIPSPVEWVELSGDLSGQIGEALNFGAYPNTTASTPITYTWEANEQETIIVSENAIGNEISFTWQTEGIKTITVTVDNAANHPVSATMTVTVTSPVPTDTKIYLPMLFNNYTPPTVLDKGEVNLTVGIGWSNPEQEDMLFGLFALNESFLSISVDNADTQISCNGQNLTTSDDDSNGIFDAGCSSTAPWLVEIKKDNIIERWHVVLKP